MRAIATLGPVTRIDRYILRQLALALATMAMACCYVLNVWIVPNSYAAFREYQFEIRNRIAAFLLQEGVFTPVSDDLTVYVRSRDADGTLHGLVIDDARNKASRATILAERGQLVGSGDTPRVLMFDGSRQEIDKQTGRLNVLRFAQNAIDLSNDAHGDEQRFRDATEMSIGELLHPPPGLVNDRDIPKLRVEAHRRLSAPLTAASFALVALLAVLTGSFRRYGNILRPLTSVLSVVGLLALGLAVNNLATRHPSLIPLMWVYAAAPGLACAWLLFGPQLGMVPRSVQMRLGTV